MKPWRAVLLSLVLFGFLEAQDAKPQPGPRPPFPQRTVDEIYQQLGTCQMDRSDLSTYVRRLQETIDARDKEIADLQARLKPAESKK